MNRITIIGNLTAKPETKKTPGGTTVATFTVAVTRRYHRDQTDFIPVVTWRALAENCARYLDKGRKVCVSGELNSRTWEDKNGNRRTAWEVTAEDVEFLDKGAAPAPEMGQREDISVLAEDDKLPF